MLAQLEGSLITEAGERVQTKCRDTKTHTHTHRRVQLAQCREKPQCGKHAHRTDDEAMVVNPLTVARFTTTKLLGNVCFQASPGTNTKIQTNVFL